MDLDKRMYLMGKGLIVLGAWAAFAGIWAVATNIVDAFSGEGWAIARVLLGIIGVAGAALLFSGHNDGKTGWQVIVGWAVLQLPYYATSPDHNITKQVVDGLLGASSQTTVNGQVTDYSAVGINIVGGIVLIAAMALRGRLDLWRRRAQPSLAT